MKFGITYGKKIPIRQYHMTEITLYTEHDDSEISLKDAYNAAKKQVNSWINQELEDQQKNERRLPVID